MRVNKSSVERSGLFVMATVAVHDIAERAKVVWLLTEIRQRVADGNVPQGAEEGEERGFASAIFSDEQRQRSEARRLSLPEATVAFYGYAVHVGIVADGYGWGNRAVPYETVPVW